MKTTYIKTIVANFNPFARSGAVPRLFLQLLPPTIHKDVKVTQSTIPRTSTAPSILELGFKDGQQMKWSWSDSTHTKDVEASNGVQEKRASLQEIIAEVDRHARILSRKEELAG